MISKRSPDTLFQLIRSLEKAEKRHFKLYIKRNSSNADLKIIQLFDAIDKQKEYDEPALLESVKSINKTQLSNLKAYLYKQILSALRLLKSSDSIDLQLNEQFDYAHILYKKGLFQQSLIIIAKAKQIAHENQKFNILLQLLSLEKRIESLHITRNSQMRPDNITKEAVDVSQHLYYTTLLSNLALKLYGWYIKYGQALNEQEEQYVIQYMDENVPAGAFEHTGFYERLYLFQSFTWYHFIRQNFTLFYKYAQKWVDLFDEDPNRKRIETGHYLKGLHYLLNAHFDLNNVQKSGEVIAVFEAFANTDRVQQHDNFKIQAFLYLTQAKMNHFFMTGTFEEGIRLVPLIEERIREYESYVDEHKVVVLNYKIATLYFGIGDYSTAIDYLNMIINDNPDLRNDLQCYARILHLFAHLEIGNDELVANLAKSVYRFMKNLKKLTKVEEEMLRFLRNKASLKGRALNQELEVLLDTLRKYEKDRFETRSFAYFNIISYLEAKLQQKTMSQIIAGKMGTASGTS